jgi:hypothetical protein
MAGFINSNFTNALSLPLKSVASAAATVVATDLVQQVANFVNPTAAVKQAEAAVKLAQTGMAAKFNNITPGINLQQSNGQIVAVNQNNQRLAVVGTTQTQSVPANFFGEQNKNRTDEFKVKISQRPLSGEVIFDVMPSISEDRQASYDPVNILHHPGEILKYKSTGNRSWSVTGTLISRSPAEASKNLKTINLIRSWLMPFYGVGTERDGMAQYLGAPPPILTLQAYGANMIGPVKCILESYGWSWPNDVDYIPTEDLIPFPVTIEVRLTLKESYSPAEYSSFSLAHYRKGDIPSAFMVRVADKQAADTKQQVTPPQKKGKSEATEVSKPPANVSQRPPTAS